LNFGERPNKCPMLLTSRERHEKLQMLGNTSRERHKQIQKCFEIAKKDTIKRPKVLKQWLKPEKRLKVLKSGERHEKKMQML
jgi:hypothetical protein